MTPISSPATSAPGTLPKPPSDTVTKATMPSVSPTVGDDVEEGRDQRAGEAGRAGRDRPGDRLHAVGPDAHQLRRGGILGHRQHLLTERRPRQQQMQPERHQQRDDAGQQPRGLDA